jgi:hypothetical protein
LAVAANQARLQKFALRLEKDEFLLEANEKAVIKKVLEDDEKWKQLNFPAYVEKDGKRVGVALTADGISFYSQILNAAVNDFGDQPDASEAKQESDSIAV